MAKRRLASALEAGKILGSVQIKDIQRTVVPNCHGIFSTMFSSDGSILMSATGKGTIEIHATNNLKSLATLKRDLRSNLPITSLQANPKNTNLVLAVDTCECVYSFCEEKNVINAVDINTSGGIYATAGKDTDIRVYDFSTHECFVTCHGKDLSEGLSTPSDEVGHGRRIFALKFHPENNNVLVSGGWDKFLKVWDIRVGNRAVRTINGPYICGQGIDLIDNYVLTASWVATNSLQIYDLISGEMIDTVPFGTKGELKTDYLYCAKYLTKQCVVAGGSGTCDVRLVDINKGELLGNIDNDRRPIQTIDIMGDYMAIGGVGPSITVAKIEMVST
ncbi:POC1 centriolar protein-like protein A [Trichoplax sp. H2]|nr:POC1 centriolar protein-like protein A [Trichoplax sp. H2]|eukprot:RDD45511.1 POC1 centriolar protein-like protein A [Trichoplax sp. H2]